VEGKLKRGPDGTCSVCKWWKPRHDGSGRPRGSGECRVGGPSKRGYPNTWATTDHGDWCGRFKPAPLAEADQP
jgi:hypothetical protein